MYRFVILGSVADVNILSTLRPSVKKTSSRFVALIVLVLVTFIMVLHFFVLVFRYTPSQQGVAFNSGAKQRVIRMVEVQKDPMEPPRFK